MTAILLFLLGIFLAVQLLASLYGVLDRWYARTREWPRMVRDLVIWFAITLAVAIVLRDRAPLLWGLGAYFLLYAGTYTAMAAKLRSKMPD